MRTLLLLSCAALVAASPAQDREIRMPRQPQVSPDGKTVAFTWQNDIWTAPISGGAAIRLTTHPASDQSPHFSPDGHHVAFVSNRSGAAQLHIVAVAGGAPRQVTHTSGSKRLLGFTADGGHLLVAESTDRGWHSAESARVFLVDPQRTQPKRMLFDAGAADAALSPDGDKVLFVRGRASWWRKGYSGPQATQLWIADLTQKPPSLQRLDADRPQFQNVSVMSPMWAPDGRGFYYVSDPDGTFDIYYRDLADPRPRRITNVGAVDRSDDGIAFPSISTDGKTIVFRRRFDLHRLDAGTGSVAKIELVASGDRIASASERRAESSAAGISFTEDGKQMAFVAGDDVYVMDRILKEPVRVTRTPQQETSIAFSADGKRLFFVSDASGEVDIWEATHSQADGIWWLAREFELRQITDDRAVESSLKLSPAGDHIAYVKDNDLFVMDSDGSDHRRVLQAWSRPTYDWAPDGKWLVYATQDSDYNSDVWVKPLDGTREPFNLSRHPDRDGSPAWSGDGKRIAFVSRRDGEESDIYYVNLTKEEEEKTERDKKLEEAIAAMKQKGPARPRNASARTDPAGGGAAGGARPGRGAGRRGGFRGRRPGAPAGQQPGGQAPGDDPEGQEPERPQTPAAPAVVTIDFDGILDRVHRISIPDSAESGLLWAPDGEKLAFSATVDGERGFYTVEFPDVGQPTRLASSGLGNARWLKQTNEIVGTAAGTAGAGDTPRRGPRTPRSPRGRFGGFGGGGTPAAMSARGQTETFGFSVRQERDWSALRQIAFDQGWRAMRDRFYDENMNNRDWQAIRTKYRPVAAQCLGAAEFSELMNMMLGELNASHMGHRGGSEPLPSHTPQNAWSPTTYHLGLRFAPASAEAGLRVASVIPGSPCSQKRSQVVPGEVVLAIDGRPVGPKADVEHLLTMVEVRDVELTVTDGEGNERKVTVRPAASVSGLLYDEWVEGNREKVAAMSDGKLGYLHIRGMDMRSFRQMEEDLYHAGHGKDGLVIDVRFNGGGSTTDHVLTALTQPVHAITRSRGSGEGYPQDRKVYASWTKPIVLMCNQHSFSNAEILSHAVKQIGRGRVVGMRTAGGVISTGSARLVDGSSVRMPTRGWYLATTGEDMELNGCAPDIALWNPPGGEDLQLQAAVTALQEDVAEQNAMDRVRIEPAAARRLRQARTTGSGGDK